MTFLLSLSHKTMAHQQESFRVTSGCLFATCSAMVTALMLLINGSLIMAILTALIKNDVPLVSNARLGQFLLFTIPVLMAIGQWMMIDFVRRRLLHKS
jgi:hypothetical protein